MMPLLRKDPVVSRWVIMNGVGAHEVIIETPNHEGNMGVLSESQFEDVLWAYRNRILDLKKDKRLRYVLIFKNQGSEAGATMEHTHFQLIALPIVPRNVIEPRLPVSSGAQGSISIP